MQQLNAIVKGHSGGGDGPREEGKAAAQMMAQKQQPVLPQKTPQKRLEKLKPTTVTPKDVIPMDDGDFKDF